MPYVPLLTLGILAAFFLLVYVSVRGDRYVDIAIESGTVVVRMRGAMRLWAFRKELRIPLDRIESVEVHSRYRVPLLRVGGTYLPGLLVAGRYRSKGEWVFLAMHPRREALEIVVAPGAKFRRVVLRPKDVAVDAKLIEQALS